MTRAALVVAPLQWVLLGALAVSSACSDDPASADTATPEIGDAVAEVDAHDALAEVDAGGVDDTVADPADAVAVDDTTHAVDAVDAVEVDDTTQTIDGVDADDVAVTPSSYTLTLGGWEMQPGAETTRCVVVRLGNAEKIWVPRIRTELSRGSHHFVVYRSDAAQERREPFPCSPFSETLGGGTVPLLISQIASETIELPPDVAFELAPHQMIRLEAHYLNYYPEPITASASVTFETMPPGDPPLVADFLFYGTTAFVIPAGESVTTPWHFYPVPEGIEVFAMTGHTHALGTNVEVETARSADEGTSVYPPPGERFKWSEAPVAAFSPPLRFGPGDGFRFRCTWKNTTDADVYFGESATREMCFFWAYYYPSRGFIVRF